MTRIMLVQVTETSSVSLYNLNLQRLQTPSMFPSIPMEISSPVQYLGFVDIQHPLKMQYVNSFIQSKRKVGLHTLDNHSPWTLHLYQWKLYAIKLVSIYYFLTAEQTTTVWTLRLPTCNHCNSLNCFQDEICSFTNARWPSVLNF